ncbi:MAG: LysE family transporter [Anaerolineales bacterium]|nr:LysE family transporter [Anaerolineales bacterium]
MTSLLAGLSLGLSAGITPGPLLTLVVTRTLSRGFAAGARVAIAPLLSDLPIIVITLLLFNAMPPWLEMALTVIGGLFLIYLGVETMRSAKGATLQALGGEPATANVDLWHGMLVNLLSPHPWLFWIAVGSPTLTHAWRISPLNAAAFLAGFYVLLVGGKIAVAFGVAGGRRYLNDLWYQRLLMLSGALLCLFGGLLLWSVLTLFLA